MTGNFLANLVNKFFGSKNLIPQPIWEHVSGPLRNPNKYAGIIYACVDINAEAIAKTRFYLVRDLSNGQTERIEKHPLLTLMSDPHPQHTWYDLLRMYGGFYQMKGEFYFLIRRKRSGEPYQLYPINPDYISEKVNKSGELVSWTIGQTSYSPNDVLSFHNFNPYNKYRGLGKIQAAMAMLDSLELAKLWNTSIYQNSANMGGLITIKDRVDEKTRSQIEDFFNKRHSGVDKVGLTGVIAGDASYHQLSTTPKELDYLESIKADERFVQQKIFRIPDIVFGDAQTGNYANGESAIRIWQQYAIEPMVTYMCKQFNEWLLPQFKDHQNLRVEYEPVVNKDRTVTLNEAQTAFNSDIITRNEARAMLDQTPALKSGDCFRSEIIQSVKENTSSVEPKDDNKAIKSDVFNHDFIRKASLDTVKLAEKKYLNKVMSVYEKVAKLAIQRLLARSKATANDEDSEDNLFLEVVIAILIFAWLRGGRSEEKYLGLEIGVFDINSAVVLSMITDQAHAHARQIVQTFDEKIGLIVANGLNNGLSKQEIADQITEMVKGSKDWLGRRVVNSEAGGGFNSAGNFVAKQSNLDLVKHWRTSALSPRICEMCIANEDMGWIKESESFEYVSNFAEDKAHPNCYCYIERDLAANHKVLG